MAFMKPTDKHTWRRGWKTLLRNVMLAVVILIVGLLLQRRFQQEVGERNARRHSHEMVKMLQERIVATPAGGAVRSLGISNKRLKAVIDGSLPADFPDLAESLTYLKNRLGADLVYAMDTNGTVVISTTYDDGKRLTGNNYAFRAYFQSAIAGKSTAYPALGATTFQRGLYYSAPIYAPQTAGTQSNAIIGVVAMKMPFDTIDDILALSSDLISLVSPQGIVLSSSNRDWLFNTIPELKTTPHADAAAVNPEYDSTFFKSRTGDLALQVRDTKQAWQGTNFFIQTFALDLDDPSGPWTLLVLHDTSAWYPVKQVLLTVLLLLALCLAVSVASYARKRRRLAIAAELHTVAEAAQTYESIFNATTDALFVHHAETGKILDANESARKLYGYSDADIESLSPDGQYPYPADAAGPALKAAMDHRKQVITFQSHGRNRPPFWAQASFSTYTIHGSVHILASVHDITEQRAAHSALTASKELLEKEVQLRTVQLLQAQKMAAIGKFAERITHDVTNAMTRIIGHADLLRHRPDDKAMRDNALKEIDRAAREMCAFSTDLLAFSHPAPLRLEPMNLVRTVAAFQNFIRLSAPTNVEIRFQLPTERLMASISPNHIEQALAQLAINSFESMPLGGCLTISLRRGESDDRPAPNTPLMHTSPEKLALIEVTDTGSGIAPENLQHVFDPFFTTKKDGKRRGLGLTTVYLIASSHNGWVNVIPHTSEPGSTVQLWIPLLNTQAKP
jgi:PAS domain S-box-containing protein